MNEQDKKYTKIAIIGIIILAIILIIRKTKALRMIQDITDKLPHNGEYAQRPLSSIDKIVVHHSATKAGEFTVYDFAKWHTDPNGRLKAPRIAYHYCINPEGKIFQCNKLSARSWHARSGNTSGIGVELDGNFEIEQPTQAQIKSLKWLINYLRNRLDKRLSVFGHNEIPGNLTACPGKNLQKVIWNL